MVSAQDAKERLDGISSALTRAGGVRRFAPDLESAFAEAMTAQRARTYCQMGLIGNGLYVLFLPVVAAIAPDMLAFAIFAGLVLTALNLALIWLIRRGHLWVESLVIAMATLVGASFAHMLLASQSPFAKLFAQTFVPVAMFANIALPLSFRPAVVFTVGGNVAAAVVIGAQPEMQGVEQVFAVFLNLTASVFMLFATHRIEAGSRKTFLFVQQEKNRADLLALTNLELRNLSDTDGLTGIGNRRFFDAALARLAAIHSATGRPLAILLLDIDRFKALNDRLGHPAGDRCLRAVASCLKGQLRGETDLIARYGGEEFAVLLSDASAEVAASCAERMRRAVEQMQVYEGAPARAVPLTISIGHACAIPSKGEAEASALVGQADKALYMAKRNGRNRVYPPLDPPASEALPALRA